MENVTISVLNECWKSLVLARQRKMGRKYKESGIPHSAGTEGRGARRRLTAMRMLLALNIEALILYGTALSFSFYLLDVGSG